MEYLVIGYYADGSGKPELQFCENADDAICASIADAKLGKEVTVYFLNPEGDPELISGVNLTI